MRLDLQGIAQRPCWCFSLDVECNGRKRRQPDGRSVLRGGYGACMNKEKRLSTRPACYLTPSSTYVGCTMSSPYNAVAPMIACRNKNKRRGAVKSLQRRESSAGKQSLRIVCLPVNEAKQGLKENIEEIEHEYQTNVSFLLARF